MTSNEALIYAYDNGYYVCENGNIYNPEGMPLKPWYNHKGYLCFTAGGKNLRVHRLAAYQWFGDAIFETGIEVRHLDGNKSNNSKTNIAIGTASENNQDKPIEVRKKVGLIAAIINNKTYILTTA